MQIIWSPSALRQLAHITDYLMDFNPRAAVQVAKSILKTSDSLVNFPHIGRIVPRTHIRELVCDYPYIIRYRIHGDDIHILRVRHTARRPTKP